MFRGITLQEALEITYFENVENIYVEMPISIKKRIIVDKGAQ